MGYIQHNAIVVTCHDSDSAMIVANKARGILLTVIGPSERVINGYCTLLICPDGSKEGWQESDLGNERREMFKLWLRENGDNLYPEWVEIQYGHDDARSEVIEDAWSDKDGIRVERDV